MERLVDHPDLASFDLVGCCLGGGVGMEFARRHPDRVRTLSLITVTTPKTIASGIFGPFERLTWPGSPTREAAWRACENRPKAFDVER